METRRSRRKAREEFFALHPHCIFCGGRTSATTWDHVPSRQMFHEKGLPERYVFPACASCNTATSGDEQVVALMARVYPDGPTPAHEQELNELIEAVRNNRPRILIEMQPSRRQVRQANSAPWASSYRADGQPPPVLSFGGPLMRQSLKAFARKLFCALHYKEFGEIIPREGHIAWRWYSNIQGRQRPDVRARPGSALGIACGLSDGRTELCKDAQQDCEEYRAWYATASEARKGIGRAHDSAEAVTAIACQGFAGIRCQCWRPARRTEAVSRSSRPIEIQRALLSSQKG